MRAGCRWFHGRVSISASNGSRNGFPIEAVSASEALHRCDKRSEPPAGRPTFTCVTRQSLKVTSFLTGGGNRPRLLTQRRQLQREFVPLGAHGVRAVRQNRPPGWRPRALSIVPVQREQCSPPTRARMRRRFGVFECSSLQQDATIRADPDLESRPSSRVEGQGVFSSAMSRTCRPVPGYSGGRTLQPSRRTQLRGCDCSR